MPLALDLNISNEVLSACADPSSDIDEAEVIAETNLADRVGIEEIERVRRVLLAMDARRFELFISDLLFVIADSQTFA